MCLSESLLQVYEYPCSPAKSRPLVWLAIFGLAWFVVWVAKHKKGGKLMNATGKIVVVVVLVASVIAVLALKRNGKSNEGRVVTDVPAGSVPTAARNDAKAVPVIDRKQGLPRLVDLGAGTCIPCKMMMPVLDELRKEYVGRLSVEFYDVRENPSVGAQYGIRVIPTQIFYDASGRERFRHEGFFSKEDILAKWKELGVDLATPARQLPVFERLAPARPDTRPKDAVCYMCDRNVNAQTLTTVQTDKGPVRLCSPHCYFIMYSCLTEDKAGFEKKVTIADWATGKPVPISAAAFLCGEDETTGRPWTKTFAGRDAALAERAASGGNVLALAALQQKELSHRCGFCDRACYPQDAAEVILEGGVHTWGCCSHCALGVAARTGRNIEVHEKDRLTREGIVVKTFDGKIAALEPTTAVAWFGQRQKPDGTWTSAGCFHQGFFTSVDNLRKWVEQNPYETGRLISISQALADKMKLSPEQIQKACKIGECAPK